MVYLEKRDLQASRGPREEGDHRGRLDQKARQEDRVTEGCKELPDRQDHQEKQEARVTQVQLVPQENPVLLE